MGVCPAAENVSVNCDDCGDDYGRQYRVPPATVGKRVKCKPSISHIRQ
jgi:hypothetical protein